MNIRTISCFLFVLLTLSCFALSSCSEPKVTKAEDQTPAKSKEAQEAQETKEVKPIEAVTLDGMKRVFLSRGVLLGSQPNEAALKSAGKDHGVKAVINLRTPPEMKSFAEEEIVKGLGMTYNHIPFGMASSLTDEVFEKARKVLRDNRDGMALMHCAVGGRVGAIWYAYLTLDCGVEAEAAMAESRTVGLGNPGHVARAKEYVAAQSKK